MCDPMSHCSLCPREDVSAWRVSSSQPLRCLQNFYTFWVAFLPQFAANFALNIPAVSHRHNMSFKRHNLVSLFRDTNLPIYTQTLNMLLLLPLIPSQRRISLDSPVHPCDVRTDSEGWQRGNRLASNLLLTGLVSVEGSRWLWRVSVIWGNYSGRGRAATYQAPSTVPLKSSKEPDQSEKEWYLFYKHIWPSNLRPAFFLNHCF